MGQGSNYAVVKDAQINLIEEEFTGDMEQRRNYAALKDAQINLIQEECVGDMGRRGSFAVVKDTNQSYTGGVCIRHGTKVK
ncbi:hypothetical protein QTG54_016577 [Skeletonema marinoi]|uniref:Uncharacterized protein n=1 Tax=Skeletonema marinoi TaxID=267567 RepID=A0AAD8XSR4_9STRA|nr:hypothetical protein QTG54_016577 [Skeletonema marinoi]